jgi:predicted XRE-type DNA-binding protein
MASTEKIMTKKEKTIEEERNDTRVTIGSGSVYADLGMKNHQEMETKSNLVIEISKAMKKKKLTQQQAAELIGISQPKLSELLSGRFRGYSVERLIHFLNALGQDVDIVVKPKPRNRRARVNVYHSPIPMAARKARS